MVIVVNRYWSPFLSTVQSYQTKKGRVCPRWASLNKTCKWFRKTPQGFAVQKNICSIKCCRCFWGLLTTNITKEQFCTMWSTPRLLPSHRTHALLLLRYRHLQFCPWNPYPKACTIRGQPYQRKTWYNNFIRWEYDLFWSSKQVQSMDQLGYQSKPHYIK